MATIVIEDLPLDTQLELSDSELDQLYGAGLRRRTRIAYRPPAEVLEVRQMLSATPLAGVLDTQIVAFDVTTTGKVAFNLSTGGYSADVELPGGIELDTTALKTLMSGSLAVPDVNPVKAAATLGGMTTSVTTNYDQIQQDLFKQYGGGNVYVSSRNFTDWASPENAASTIGGAVLTGGSTTGQIIQEAKDVILNELGNIYTWLQNKAPKEAEALVAGALKAIVTGKDFDGGNLQIKMLNVNETYKIGLGGGAGQLAAGLGVATSKSVTAVHKGFAVIWKGSGDSLQSLTNSLNNFTGASMSGKGAFGELIANLAKNPELKGLGKLAEAILTSNPGALADQLVTSKLAAALNLTPAQVKQLYKPGNPIIDLKATQLDEQLVKLFTQKVKLAAGNEGSVAVTKLQFNLNTFEITAEVSLHHRHTWGSINEILANVGKVVGKWVDKAGNYVSQGFNAAGNMVRDTITKGVDKVTQVFDKAGNQLLNLHRTLADVMLSRWEKTAAGYISTTYTKGVETARAVWENGVNTAYTTWNTAGTVLTKYWVDGKQTISQWFTNGKCTAENIYKGSVCIAEKAWKDGVCTLNRARDDVGKLVSEYWKTGTTEVQKLYTKGVQTAYSEWQKGVNTVYNVWDSSGKKVSEYWRNGADEFQNLFKAGVRVDYAKWTYGVNLAHYTYDDAGAIATAWWKDGTKSFKNIYQSGVVVAQNVWENGKNIAQHAWDTSGKYLGDALSKGGGTAKDWLGKVGISF